MGSLYNMVLKRKALFCCLENIIVIVIFIYFWSKCVFIALFQSGDYLYLNSIWQTFIHALKFYILSVHAFPQIRTHNVGLKIVSCLIPLSALL